MSAIKTENRTIEVCDCDVIDEAAVAEVRANMPPVHELLSLAELFKMFSDPTRLAILQSLSLRDVCVCDLAALLGVTKSAVSHQLKSLRLLNLVKYERRGKIVTYSLADDHVKSIIEKGMEHIHE
jgi:DNA-binding transcriptional ArsR family regulator